MNDIVLLLMACVMLAEGQILGNVPSQDLGPVYKLRRFIRRDLNLAIREEIVERLNLSEVVSSSTETHFEWEGYDGWYNNPAHPEWGGADFPLERKTPVVYDDGVYEIVAEEKRGNVLVISNLTQHGLSGLGSSRRTAFFIFFGQQVVEEMLDAQRPGCIPEYENMRVPKCHALYDPDCRADRFIPFLRNRYDFGTGYHPNNPRMQLNEITPWLDGGLVYGPVKAWTDAIRAFEKGYLSVLDTSENINTTSIADMFPRRNDIGLPLANSPPPANASLFPVNRFWTIGNPRGDENPFLLTMGILWYRVHQWWTRQLYNNRPANVEEYEEDEWLFNRARQFTIATYQHIVYDEWMPIFIPRKFVDYGGEQIPYTMNKGYSTYFNRTGYNPAINPQVAHIFQSAAMRFGHTMVTPGIWRRQLDESDGGEINCLFGPPLSFHARDATKNYTNSFLRRIDDTAYTSWQDLVETFGPNTKANSSTAVAIQRLLNNTLYDRNGPPMNANGVQYNYDTPGDTGHFAIRTCNSFWNPQVSISETNVDPLYLGMSSQATEREDTIITPDLRGKVFGPLDFTRRDLMAVNMQRARDHGLPDFNSARAAYGLRRLTSFEELNPLYGVDEIVTRNIEDLRDVYNNDINRCDIWACGLAETIPSDVENPELQQISGPGELFSEVLFDQFMRIRHGDRFWWENYEANGIFTEAEFNLIKKLRIKDLLVLTTHIRDGDISNTPFVIDDNTVCPQPFQLSELYMDDCTDLSTFDYSIQSTWEMSVTWALAFLYIELVIMVRMFAAACYKHRKAGMLASGLVKRSRKVEGTEVTGRDGSVLLFWEVFNESKENLRQVIVKFGPGRHIKTYFSDNVVRDINLCHQTQLTIQRPVDDQLHLAIKIPREYDVVLLCKRALDRTIFLDKLQSFLTDIGVGCTIEEPQKIMESAVYTKKDRQQLIEDFFKSLFSEGKSCLMDDSREKWWEILEYELTREEFADAMSLRKDSLFVEQMFQLVDQEGNGLISVRKFVDVIIFIFTKGSVNDKLSRMFDSYDINRKGELDNNEIKKLLNAILEIVSTPVSSNHTLDENIQQMLHSSCDFENKQTFTIEDLHSLLRDNNVELPVLDLNAADTLGIEGDESSTSEILSTHPHCMNTQHALNTVIKAYGRRAKEESHSNDTESVPILDIPIQERKLSSFGRRVTILLRWMENYRLQIFYLTLFELVTVAIFVERAYYYSVEREHAGLRRITGHFMTIARGSSSVMMFTYSVLLLTMSRNFITYLRDTILNQYLPFDSYILFHKIVALEAIFFTFVHIIAHGINFHYISAQPPDDLTCIFPEVYHSSHTLPRFSYWLFLTMSGFSGFILFLVTTIMLAFSIPYMRRHASQAFWYTHRLYIIFYILSFLHGSGRLVQDPLFGNFFLGPGIIYAIDLLISCSRKKHTVCIMSANVLPSKVVSVHLKRPVSFSYEAGQWLKVASAGHNPGEYHSFTITSAPHEEYLSLHIRAVGPWTYNFLDHCNHAHLCEKPYPKLFIDGPFGEGHQDWFRYEVAILVGGGIGVTPFASILKELVHRFNIGARVECRKVFFIWVTRSLKQWEWFTDIIKDVEESDVNNLVEAHMFVTQDIDKFDIYTTMLFFCECHVQKLSKKNLFTGLHAVTHFGRPDFNQFFDNLQEEYIVLPKIGVFSCGPPGMTNGVEAACAATNRFDGPAFIHHTMNF